MPSLVVDASVIVDLLVDASARDRIVARIVGSGDLLHAPHSIDLEVAQALRKLWRRGAVSEESVAEMFAIFHEIRIRRHPHEPLIDRIWQLRHNITAYDAAYVALAEKLAAPLVTRDARLARATGHAARIEHIA